MHQSNFSSQNDLLRAGSVFQGESETQTTYTETLTHTERSKGECRSLPGSKKRQNTLKR